MKNGNQRRFYVGKNYDERSEHANPYSYLFLFGKTSMFITQSLYFSKKNNKYIHAVHISCGQ